MTASELADYVVTHPGVHFNDLVDTLDVTPERLARLGDELEREQTIVTASLYGQTHFYPPTYDEREREVIALLRRETSRDILLALLAEGPASPGDVADEVGIARSTLEWHLDRLVGADLVTKSGDGWRVQLDLVDPAEVEDLLADLQPSFANRAVDRTSRLLDHLLE